MFRCVMGFCTAATMLLAAALARAGGDADLVMPQHNPADEGVSFFGIVKDARGTPLADATVTTTVKNGPVIMIRSDAAGLFNTGPFARSVVATEVTVACEKDGYAPAKGIPRTVVKPDTKKPVEMLCRLARQ
jgi:hypothetical protein